MKILSAYIREVLLLEGRLEDIKSRYLSSITDEQERKELENKIETLRRGDPSPNLKYLSRMVDLVMNARVEEQATIVQEVISTVRMFHDLANKRILGPEDRDINNRRRYPDLGSIRHAVEQASERGSKSEETREVKAGAHKIYESDRFLVVHPETKEATQFYGAGSRWCIAAKASHNYFSSYSRDDNLFYIIIDKQGGDPEKNVFAKVAMQVGGQKSGSPGSITYWDASDRSHSGDRSMLNAFGDEFNHIKSAVVEDVNKRPPTPEWILGNIDKADPQQVIPLLSSKSESLRAKATKQFPGEIPVDVRRQLLRDPSPLVRSALASRPHILDEEVMVLLRDRDPEVLRSLAGNKNISKDAFYSLSQSDDVDILRNLSGNTTAVSLEGLPERLLEFDDEEIVLNLTLNSSTPDHVKSMIREKGDDIANLALDIFGGDI